MNKRNGVLVVDDTLASLRLVVDVLTAAGHRVRPATCGEDALMAVTMEPPELILLDVCMPGMDGFEVCRRLKQREESRDIPVLFLSASVEPEERVNGFALGAVDFIGKPFLRDELLARVRTHLKLSQMQEELEAQVRKRTAELAQANEQLQRHREHLEELVTERTAELRASEESLRLILDNLPDAVFIHEPDGTIVTVNRKMAEMYGLAAPAAAAGLLPREFSAPDMDAAQSQVWLAAAMRGEEVRFEWQAMVPATGRQFPVEVSLRRIMYAGRACVLASVRDITERKAAAAALACMKENLETMLDGVDSLVYVADMATFEMLFLNKQGRDVFPNYAPGRKCYEVLQAGQAAPCAFCTNDRLLDAAGKPTGTYCWEFQNTATHDWFECRDQAIRWHDGRMVRLEFATNITARKQEEEAFRRHAEELEILNRAMTGRELRIIELKEEVNARCRELGRPPAYPPDWVEVGRKTAE